jgi:MFS family permease
MTTMMKKSTLQPWLVCLPTALFFFYGFIQMRMFNSISPDLMQNFNINSTELVHLSALYFYADFIFLFFADIIVDHFSVRKIILSAMLIYVVITVIFALSTTLLMANIRHFITGIGNAFCFLSCVKPCSHWFPTNRMAC